MSADAPLSYFYSRAAAADAFGHEPSQALRASSPKGGAFQRLLVSSNKALPERVLYNSLLQIFFDLLPQMQETAALIRIINRRLPVFFYRFHKLFFQHLTKFSPFVLAIFIVRAYNFSMLSSSALLQKEAIL